MRSILLLCGKGRFVRALVVANLRRYRFVDFPACSCDGTICPYILMAVCRNYPIDRLLHRFERSGILLMVRIGKPQFAKQSKTDVSDGFRLRVRACWLYRLVESIVGPIGGSREACLQGVFK